MKEHLNNLHKKVQKFPSTSGCYKMYSKDNKILYIGKAKNLRARVKNYFLEKIGHKTKILMKNVANIEIITTNSEYEALLLECNLIKKHKPDYNIKLKDDKGYPMIRITCEKYPRIFKTRKIINDGSEYFGPYVNAKNLNLVLALINKTFKTRKCKKKSKNPCLYFHMGQCLGVCHREDLEEQYKKEVNKIRHILNGNISKLLDEIEIKMKEVIKKEDFETAIKLKETKKSLIEISQTQIITRMNKLSTDYIYTHKNDSLNVIVILKYRDGKLVEKDINFDESIYEEDELTEVFITQYYTSLNMIVPDKIHIFKKIDTTNITKLINEFKDKKIEIIYKETPDTIKIMEMAISNAEIALRSYDNEQNKALESLKIILEMTKLPKTIEGFDIAHLNGYDTVASLITFKMGKPFKNGYRVYKINSLNNGEIDDFKAIREVTFRRYSKLINEQSELPDLVLIDGGKGQLSSAYSALKELKIEDKVSICALAKKEEIIFLPNKIQCIQLPKGHSALKILQNIRDEAHRKANSFNKKLRRNIKLNYSNIEGIGEQKAKNILKTLGTYKDILLLSEDEIAKKIRTSIKTAKRIKEFSNNQNLKNNKS
ncbi:UvrABC system protein C [Borrelia miyamotoi]|uniref:UvrABC system protein C n=1 Tax=Borrelia miyamotoi TaxID=47466 RepID=A0AAP8YVJ6_9SPIR|nr:excinuclease ABC subunit UvrC [Borrelia miyamotoi]AHH04952.1 Excinuclease ABC subunit C [Borrelia miyamotoi FR64b]ATQ14768.1 excinuclease ABC subunit UvrC [Borrelia miyamotoi]ATQ15952.1 excinuclease ABC subunit UvrC [Borrelia miyamotoi]ATQ17096.1 excinuclease ABC subunit UvrC [Borrelia miyamotoi]ATQ18398.1 excinuclease ABC subunit UvrC [Borrelia miyamotoi]